MTANKAWVAAAVAALASFIATIEGRPQVDTMRPVDWLLVVLAALVAGGTVYLVPNRDPRGTHQAESVQPPVGPT